MLDPITAVSTATAAYNVIKKGIMVGREIEGMTNTLSKWYTAVSDFNHAEQELKERGGVSKLLFKGSIEAQALHITINKQKIIEQEKELRTLIMYTYGNGVYEEMIDLRRKLKKQRQEAVYKKREFRRQLLEAFLIFLLIALSGALIVGIIAFVMNK